MPPSRVFGSKVTVFALALGAVFGAAACSASPSSSDGARAAEAGRSRQAFTSSEATLVDFDWDGEVVTDWTGGAPDAIGAQMLYTVGSLNDFDSVGQLEKLVTTNVVVTPQADGRYRVTYHAKLPVAWNVRRARPSTFALTLPRVGIWNSLVTFSTAYGTTCVESGAHDVNAGSLWYFYRPRMFGCTLASSDVVNVNATVTLSTGNTTGKYPEYHRVWQDDVLDAVVVYGKYEEGVTSSSDPGIAGYGLFVERMRQRLAAVATSPITTVPASIAARPGAEAPDVTLEAILPYSKKVRIHMLLVDNVRTQGPAFDARFAQLTPEADIVMYHGHAGLGANVRSLLEKGSYTAGHHLLFFMNGCDTFAYVDGRLREARAALNADDPAGTKYLDMVTNAMPSYADAFSSEPVMLEALVDYATPRTYADIFRGIDYRQVVVVTGEEDNEFVPGIPVGSVQPPAVVETDAGSPNDAETRPDASGAPTPAPTASSPAPSTSSTPSSTPTTPSTPEDGCACVSAPGSPTNGSPFAALGFLASLVLLATRRRR